MSAQRNTIQKTLVKDALRTLHHPTAEEVYQYVHAAHPTISKATLYRNLKKMSDEGSIVKVDTPGGTAARFDDTVHEHFHGKCRVCGNVYDIDMDKAHANGLKEKVNDSHGFEIENQEVVFIGVCPNCRK